MRPALCLLIVLCIGAADSVAADNCSSSRGETLFVMCAICHSTGMSDAHGVGPNLSNVFERSIGNAQGFAFSLDLREAKGVWSKQALDRFLADPMSEYPGTSMAFGGVRNIQDRSDLICYLQSLAGQHGDKDSNRD